MPTTATTDRLARAAEDLSEILQAPHPATPFLQQGTVVNDAMEQLKKIFTPPTRIETAMAAPTPRVLETAVAAPRVDVNNNNNYNHSPRVAVTTTTTTTDRLQRVLNRLTTKSAPISERSSRKRTKSVRFPENCEGPSALRTKLSQIAEEILPYTTGTKISKAFKKNHKTKNKHLNGIISSYNKDREYYMIEYEDGDSKKQRR